VIPYGHQTIEDDDVDAVVAVLRGDWLTQGPAVELFEAALSLAAGAKYAVAFSSGTAALHGACAAAGLGTGDVVATSSLSFSASAACARYVGARPLLLDIDPSTLNTSTDAVPDDVDAFIAVHYAGLPLDLRTLRKRPRVVIEDAAHALGAMTPDGPVGNCAQSDLCCFSFHPVKPVTTAEGGAVTTNDPDLANALRRFRNHGIEQFPQQGGWYYEIESLGYNYRLTDIQASLGVSQLAKLKGFIDRRNQIAVRYRAMLVDLPLELPPVAREGWRHAYHLFPIQVESTERRRVFDGMRSAGIGVQVHYVPIHRHPAYADLGHSAETMPNTERAYSRLLSIPMYPGLTPVQQETVVSQLARLLR
jgi:UDP-4-amino-4,6-dideoxy-N-acetyl-beta-L-altrosamine transaminase